MPSKTSKVPLLDLNNNPSLPPLDSAKSTGDDMSHHDDDDDDDMADFIDGDEEEEDKEFVDSGEDEDEDEDEDEEEEEEEEDEKESAVDDEVPETGSADDGIDFSNIVSGKRVRKPVVRYEDEVFKSKEYAQMMLCDVPVDEIEAALVDEDFSEDESSVEDAYDDDEDDEDEGDDEEAKSAASSVRPDAAEKAVKKGNSSSRIAAIDNPSMSRSDTAARSGSSSSSSSRGKTVVEPTAPPKTSERPQTAEMKSSKRSNEREYRTNYTEDKNAVDVTDAQTAKKQKK